MKVLIINTQSVNHANATGVTLRSFLKYLPAEDFTELYLQPCDAANDALPIKSIRLGFREAPLRFLANKFIKGGKTETIQTGGQNGTKKSLKKRLLARLIMMLDYEPVFVSRRIKNAVKAFSPDCIYTLGNAVDAMKYACKVSERFGLRILPHFMDNWQESHRYGPSSYPGHRKLTQRWLNKLYAHSVCALTISEKMADVYERKRRVPHYALMNAIDVNRHYVDEPEENCTAITYAGGLHLNRYKSLMEVAREIDLINERRALHLQLRVFTDQNSRKLYGGNFSECKCIVFCEYLPHERVDEIYRTSRILVHIESFDPGNRSFILYSLSTKISEYLSTGLPILLYAPKDIFISEYLRENDAAATVCDKSELFGMLEKLLFDREYCRKISDNALKLAREKHNVKASLDLFERALNETANGRNNK